MAAVGHVQLFALLQVIVTAYAVVRGGAPERIAGVALLLAYVCSRLLHVPFPIRFRTVEWNVFLVDVCLSILLLGLALYADRFWTLWLAALQILGTGAHLVKLVDHEVVRLAYAVLVAVWSYPMLALLAAGTARHARRLRMSGTDVEWSIEAAAREEAINRAMPDIRSSKQPCSVGQPMRDE